MSMNRKGTSSQSKFLSMKEASNNITGQISNQTPYSALKERTAKRASLGIVGAPVSHIDLGATLDVTR